MSKPEYRKAERDAFCRVCDKTIKRGEYAVFWYSFRNRGQYINVCPSCVENLYELLFQKIIMESIYEPQIHSW